jgi:hypothetical protein
VPDGFPDADELPEEEPPDDELHAASSSAGHHEDVRKVVILGRGGAGKPALAPGTPGGRQE